MTTFVTCLHYIHQKETNEKINYRNDYPKHAVIGTGGADGGDDDSTSAGCDGDSTSSVGGAGGQ